MRLALALGCVPVIACVAEAPPASAPIDGDDDSIAVVADPGAPEVYASSVPGTITGNVTIHTRKQAAKLVGTRIITGNLTVESAAAIAIDFSSLERVDGAVTIHDSQLSSLSFPRLVRVGRSLTIQRVRGARLELPALELVGQRATDELVIADNRLGGTAIALPRLNGSFTRALPHIAIRDNHASAVALPSLSEVDAMEIRDPLTTLGLDMLVRADRLVIDDVATPILALPALVRGTHLAIAGTSAGAVSLPALRQLDSAWFVDNARLGAIDAPRLTALSTLSVQSNPMLATCQAAAIAARASATDVDIVGSDDAGTCP